MKCPGAPLLVALPFALAGALAGCLVDDERCVANDECTLDAICTAGQCVAIENEGEGEGEGEGESEGEGEVEGEGEGEGEPPRCSLEDGALGADELPVVLGVPLRYQAVTDPAAEISVDVEGTASASARVWDFTTALPGEALFSVTAMPLADQWYAGHFTDAPAFVDGVGAYVAPLSDEMDGVFEKRAAVLVLLGVASLEEGRTAITYDPPIVVLSFPLEVGRSWVTETVGSGTYEYSPFYLSSDVYDSAIDAQGTAETAAGVLPVLRLRLEQQVTIGLLAVTQRKYTWLSPCIGVIAQVESDTGETEAAFTTARHARHVAAPGSH